MQKAFQVSSSHKLGGRQEGNKKKNLTPHQMFITEKTLTASKNYFEINTINNFNIIGFLFDSGYNQVSLLKGVVFWGFLIPISLSLF